MGNQSLVLQSLGRNATGNYYCVATNSEGTAFSNPVQLDIKCKYLIIIKSPTTEQQLKKPLCHIFYALGT